MRRDLSPDPPRHGRGRRGGCIGDQPRAFLISQWPLLYRLLTADPSARIGIKARRHRQARAVDWPGSWLMVEARYKQITRPRSPCRREDLAITHSPKSQR